MRWKRWAGHARRRWALVIAVAVAVTALSVGLAVAFGGRATYATFGVSDPGWPVRFVTPLLRFVSYVSASLCLGALAFAAFFTAPQDSGVVAPSAYAALRSAAVAAWSWAATALLLVFFDSAATAGLPVHRVLNPAALVVLVDAQEPTKAWLVVCGCATVVAIGATRILRWRSTFPFFAVAVLATLAPAAAGHAGSGIGHDWATGAAALHIPAGLVWLGTLAALVRARALAGTAPAVWARYRRLSLVCAVVVCLSGLPQTAIFIAGPPGSGRGYLVAIAAQLAIFAAVLAIVLSALRRIRVRPESRARVLAAEIVLLILSVGVSAVLAHLPTPNAGWQLSVHQALIGYDLTEAPSLVRLVTKWRFDVLLGTVSLLLAAGYGVVWARLRRSGRAWPTHRLTCWWGGCALWLVASSSGLGRYALGMFSAQLTRHVLVGMVVPVLLVLGAPLTLARLGLRPARPGRPPGPAEWAETLRTSATLRALTHPLVATLAFAGLPFVMYFTPLLDLTIRYHWAHLPVEIVTVAVGYLFAWVIVGADPLPVPVPHIVRLGALLATMPSCAVLAAAVMNARHVLGDSNLSGNFYTAMNLPWVRGPLADQHLGGLLALVTSETTLWVLLALLVIAWGRSTATGMPDFDEMVVHLGQRAGPPGQPAGAWDPGIEDPGLNDHTPDQIVR